MYFPTTPCQSNSLPHHAWLRLKESLNKSFDRLRTNGNVLIPFVMSLPKGMTGIHLFRASLMFHRLVLLRAAKP